jgi:hypothetical protein
MTDEAERQASRKAIKEGMIRQSTKNPLDKPASDLDVETALALAKLYDQEDITCPPQRHSTHSASGRDAFLGDPNAHDAAFAVPVCPDCQNEHENDEPC